jgi:hypothetical protein
MKGKVLAVIIVIVVAVAVMSGVIACRILQSENLANQDQYAVTITYHCQTVPNENGVISVIGIVTTNYTLNNVTFAINGNDFYLRYQNRGGYNQPDVPQASMNSSVTQMMILYNNSKFGELDFNASVNPSSYFDPSAYYLIYKGSTVGTVVANDGVPFTLKLIEQTP